MISQGIIALFILTLALGSPLPPPKDVPAVAIEWGTEVVDEIFDRGLYTRDNLTAYASEGTNKNAPGVSAAQGGFGLADSNALTSYTSQPLGFDHDGCGYAYAPTLSGSNPILTSLVNSFTIGQVDQSKLGDCGFGAALIAAKANKSPGLANIFTVTSKTQFIAHFWASSSDTARHAVYVDDQLLRPAKTGCETLASFEPTGGLLVPLLEKAFAKFVNVYPSFKVTPSASGYNALEAYSNAVLNCFNIQQPCALATTDIGNIVNLIGNNPAVNTVRVNKNTDLFSFYDVDQGKRVAMVASHWYGLRKDISPTKITPTTSNNTPNKIMVTITNPWGHNFNDENQNSDGPADVRVSLRALYAVTSLVDTSAP